MRVISIQAAALAVAVSAAAPGAFAAEPTAAAADVLNCSRLSDPGVRLACFDSAAAALQRSYSPPAAAVSSPPPAAAAQPPQAAAPPPAQTSAPPPPAAAFARPAPPPPTERPAQVRRATGALRQIETAADGRMVVTLEDGSVWRQIDDRRLPSPPEPGTPVEVRRGVWGAYFLDFEGQREIRARRVN